ncbi:MAG: hypothetical protein WBG30_08860 [Psychrilyobacter sp.]|uniref:hypothetical protein n=1 Tax=Psychrilyobacter sp. TaxID=2586924 RepID=UPI003C731280
MKEKNIILSTGSQGKTLFCTPTTIPSHKQLVDKIESFIEILNSTKDHLLMVDNLCGLKNYLKKEETIIEDLIDKVIADCHQQDKEFNEKFKKKHKNLTDKN